MTGQPELPPTLPPMPTPPSPKTPEMAQEDGSRMMSRTGWIVLGVLIALLLFLVLVVGVFTGHG